jgi:hypothetical protein
MYVNEEVNEVIWFFSVFWLMQTKNVRFLIPPSNSQAH